MGYFLLKKIFFCLSLSFLGVSAPLFATETVKKKPLILVSIAPYRAFVRAIAGATVNVQVMVPPGSSSHTFDPTPKQMIAASQAEVWLQIGETFEEKFTAVALKYNPVMRVVNLREGVDLIKIDHEHHPIQCACHKNFEDIHFWLSPKEVKVQVEQIQKVLSTLEPAHAELYQKNLIQFCEKLERLDQEIRTLLKDCSSKVMMVSHPAFAYFARDYGVTQLSVESEGKDPTSRQLTELIKAAEQVPIKTVFIQPQYNNKGALLIARHLQASVVTIDPYTEDFFEMMRTLARNISCKEQGNSL